MKAVISKKSFSEQQLRKNRIIKYSVITVVLIVLVFLIKYVVSPLFNIQIWLKTDSFVILFLMLLGAASCLMGQGLFNMLDSVFCGVNKNIGISMAGHEGEQKVFKELSNVLGDKYTVYPNYVIPGHKFDLDFLIVGPKGLIVVEVKNFSNATVFSEDKALSVKELGYKKEVIKLVGSSDPRNKIDTHCKVLNRYLNYLGFDNIGIKKVLVFAKDHVTIDGKSKIFIVKKITELGKYFDNLYQDERFTPEFCKELNTKLS